MDLRSLAREKAWFACVPFTDVRAIAIFNPPLIGDETNDEEGGYAKADDYKAR